MICLLLVLYFTIAPAIIIADAVALAISPPRAGEGPGERFQ